MPVNGTGEWSARDTLLEEAVPNFREMAPKDQERLREMAEGLQQRGLPLAFVLSSIRSTADVMREMREEEERADNVFQREHVRKFMEEHAVTDPKRTSNAPRRERKREERDRLQAHTLRLIREARQARGRHEVKKTRNMLLKLDQRELRRMLGHEGDDLCRQINTWLRSTAAMF